MPGSLNTKSETIVSWEVQVDADCHVPRYTLAQLNERLGIEHTPMCQDKETAPRTPRDLTAKVKRGRAGWEALRARRFNDFLDLWKMRGSFRTGCRNNTVFYYSLLLAQWGIPIQKAKAAAEQLNAACKPPLKLATVQSAVKSAYSHRYKKLCDQTIADWLDITPEEASSLKCKAAATRFNVETDKPASKPKRIDEDTARITSRRAAILQIITGANGLVPRCGKMAYSLKQQGYVVSYKTVSRDYKHLGLKAKQVESEYISK
jgi:hypothetical protein